VEVTVETLIVKEQPLLVAVLVAVGTLAMHQTLLPNHPRQMTVLAHTPLVGSVTLEEHLGQLPHMLLAVVALAVLVQTLTQ
jgi:hypothetical protein